MEWGGLLAKLGQTWPAQMAQGMLGGAALPGQVAGGILATRSSVPGQWSDEDEARQQLTQQTMVDRAADLGGMVMGGGFGMAPAGSAGMSGARLGSKLPMDESSRMARAAEQGFTIDAYKGMPAYHPGGYPTTNGFGKILEPAKMPMTEIAEINAGRNAADPISNGAGFFSNSPAVASRFAEAFGNEMSGAVYPVKLRMENPKVIDAGGRYAADFQFGAGAGQLKLPKDSPHDGVILKNTKDEGDVYIPSASKQIRSRWAAFDPANKDSGYLLGVGNPLAALLMQATQAQAAP